MEILPGSAQVSGIRRLRQRYIRYTESQKTTRCSLVSFGLLKDKQATKTYIY